MILRSLILRRTSRLAMLSTKENTDIRNFGAVEKKTPKNTRDWSRLKPLSEKLRLNLPNHRLYRSLSKRKLKTPLLGFSAEIWLLFWVSISCCSWICFIAAMQSLHFCSSQRWSPWYPKVSSWDRHRYTQLQLGASIPEKGAKNIQAQHGFVCFWLKVGLV